jgi:hypothetical protein
MDGTIAHRLVDDDIAIANLHIVQAAGIGTNPRLVLNRSTLAPEIRERNQIAFAALTAPGKFQRNSPPSFEGYLFMA